MNDQPAFPKTIAGATLALLGWLLLASAPVSAGDEVELLDQWPTCPFERLGKVEAKDGREVGVSAGGSRRANLKRAESNLRRQAGKLDASRVVLTQRKVQRDGKKIRYVHLIGIAIGPCEDA